MKLKPIYLFILAFVIISCEDSGTNEHSTTDNVAVIDSLYLAFSTGDIETVMNTMSDSIYWNAAENYIYGGLQPYVGPQAVKENVIQKLGAEWEYWKLEQMELAAVDGGRVLATGRYLAKHKASGNALDAQFAHLWTVKDGKATRFQQFTDTKQIAEVVTIEAEAPDEDAETME